VSDCGGSKLFGPDEIISSLCAQPLHHRPREGWVWGKRRRRLQAQCISSSRFCASLLFLLALEVDQSFLHLSLLIPSGSTLPMQTQTLPLTGKLPENCDFGNASLLLPSGHIAVCSRCSTRMAAFYTLPRPALPPHIVAAARALYMLSRTLSSHSAFAHLFFDSNE
jgi:hypothetical protein